MQILAHMYSLHLCPKKSLYTTAQQEKDITGKSLSLLRHANTRKHTQARIYMAYINDVHITFVQHWMLIFNVQTRLWP